MKKLKPDQIKKLSTDKKINYIIDQLEKIDRAVNPSFIKQLTTWFGSHWFIVLVLAGISYFGLQLWDEVQAILDFMDRMNQSVDSIQGEFAEVKGQVEDVKVRVSEAFDGLKFWRYDDPLKNQGLN